MNHVRILLLSGLLVISICQSAVAQIRILFDATKAETAGNADWVIDADQTNLKYSPNASTGSGGTKSNAQRIPTPAQSGITASSPESFWKGGISGWGVDCAKRGYIVETLPWNDSISFGNASHATDLSNYDVFVVCEPNILFTAAEKYAMMKFMAQGGAIFMVSDHNNSDRNNDSYDSPAIWNDLFTNNGYANNALGVSVELNSFSETSTNVQAAASDSVINGPYGSVTSVMWSSGASIAFSTSVNPTIKAVVMRTGMSPAGGTGALFVYGRFGNGRFALIGDSSPCDDGTGNTSVTLYDGYFTDAGGNHQKLLMNAMVWLATKPAPVQIAAPSALAYSASNYMYTYPASFQINTPSIQWNNEVGSFSWMNSVAAKFHINTQTGAISIDSFLSPGNYTLIVKASNSKGFDTASITIRVKAGLPIISSISTSLINQTCIPIDSMIIPTMQWNGDTGIFRMSPAINGWQLDSIHGIIHVVQSLPINQFIWLKSINSAGADSIQIQVHLTGIPVHGIQYSDSVFTLLCTDTLKTMMPTIASGCKPYYFSVKSNILTTHIDSMTGMVTIQSTGHLGRFPIWIMATNAFGRDSIQIWANIPEEAASVFYYTDSLLHITQSPSPVYSLAPTISWNCKKGIFTLVQAPSQVNIDSITGIVHFNPTDTGQVDVWVQANDRGRSSLAHRRYIITQQTGLSLINSDGFHIYPNPFSNQLFIQTDVNSPRIIQCIGLDGKMYLEQVVQSAVPLDTSILPDGVYLVRGIDPQANELRISKPIRLVKISK